MRNEFVASRRKAIDAPVEQKHQILEHFESDQWDFSLCNRVDNPTNADPTLNLADSERFDVGDLAVLLEILVENHAQASEISLRILHDISRPHRPCCPCPASRRREDCRSQTPLLDRSFADNKHSAGPERDNSCRPSCLGLCALRLFHSESC